MKICAITMVHNDHWALKQWIRHNGPLFGLQHLYVVAHGSDPEIARIAAGANVITIPRDSLEGFDVVRNRVLNGLQASLSNVFDWVIRTDVDELIVVDPSLHASPAAALEKCATEAVFALGCDLVQGTDQMEVLFTGHYSKAFAVTDDTRLFRHGVRVRSKLARDYRYQMPEGVFLVHLKYANKAELKRSNIHRQKIAEGQGKGLPGAAWQDPVRDARRMFAKVAKMDCVTWDTARKEAYEDLSTNPVRTPETGLVRCRSERFTRKTLPPAWFPDLS